MAGTAAALQKYGPIVAPHVLNAIAGLSPKLKGPRKLIKQLTGFASRQVSSVKKSGKARKGKRSQGGRAGGALVGGAGGFVHTVNAPVAFAHTTTARPGFYIKHIDADTILVHSVDFVTNLSASSTAGGFNLQQWAVDPTDGALFTYLAPLLDLYTKYRNTQLKMHYVHSCATNVNGLVMMTWCPDPNTTVPATQSQMMNTNDAIAGSCYEDFAYEANPKEFQNDWQYISDVTDADEDDRLIRNGCFFVSSINASIASQPLGSFMVESEWLLTGRRDPVLAPMLVALRTILQSKGTSESKEEVAANCAKQFVRNILARKKASIARPVLESAYESIAKMNRDSGSHDNSSELNPRSIAESIPQSALKTPNGGRR